MDYNKPPHLRANGKQQPPHLRAVNKQQQSNLVGGKDTKSTRAEPPSNLSSSVYNPDGTNTSGFAWSGKRPANLTSTDRPVSEAKTTPTAWNGSTSANQASSSKASNTKQQPASTSSWHEFAAKTSSSNPPSLRQQPAEETSLLDMPLPHLHSKAAAAAQAPKPTPPMNAGKIAKSAKQDSKVPCTYEDCTRGFTKESDMKRHKDEDHDWCRLCNVDCADDVAFLEHKVLSEMHICCDVCGEDFRSERGKERHMRQNHAMMQEVNCPACHMSFERGSGLINHIYNNRCRDRRGFIAEKVNQNVLREYRAVAALHLDAISNRPSTTGQEIAAMQPQSERGTSFVDNSEGGVRLNLMDDDTPIGHLTARSLSRAAQSDLSEVDSTTASNGTEVPTFDDGDTELPATSGDTSKSQVEGSGVIEGLQALRTAPSTEEVPTKQAWAAKLFPGAKPTPVVGGWTAPTKFESRRRVITPSDSASENPMRSDWDTLTMDRDPVDDMYHCPFTKCLEAFNQLDHLRLHLASGFHQGTDHRCLKCLKIFKSPAALTAHMESSSERCKIRESQAYGHVLHVVSGGFLKVTGRHADGSIKVEAPTMEEIEEQIQSQTLPPHLDENYPW